MAANNTSSSPGNGRRGLPFDPTAAAHMRRALKAASDSPDIRADLVAQLKARIADGSYTIDSEALADKLLGRRQTVDGEDSDGWRSDETRRTARRSRYDFSIVAVSP